MSTYIDGEIRRDGFRSSNGRFRTLNGGERVSTERLKAAFLPKLTPEGKKMVQDDTFVRSQLQHYGLGDVPGVETGCGTLAMKKALLAGQVRSFGRLQVVR
jgi:hypothetical protein